jgi:hypothetical protein
LGNISQGSFVENKHFLITMIRLALQTFFLLLTSAIIVQAQPAGREVVNQPIQWLSATAHIKMSKTLSGILEGQYRYAGSLDPMQYQIRTALEVRLNDHFSIVPIGYVWTENFLYGEQPAKFKNNEHRLWEQVSYKHKLGRFKLDHRLRLEQRFVQVHTRLAEGQIVEDGYTNRQNRLRYRFMTKASLARNKEIGAGILFASAYDEVFYSWGKAVTFDEPDQNRVFAGLGYQVSKPLSVQAGMLYQMLIKANGAQQENNVGLQIMLNYTLDLAHQ